MAFNGLTKLKEMRFKNNKIKEIDPTTLNALSNLENLDFYKNNIKELDPNTFDRKSLDRF